MRVFVDRRLLDRLDSLAAKLEKAELKETDLWKAVIDAFAAHIVRGSLTVYSVLCLEAKAREKGMS